MVDKDDPVLLSPGYLEKVRLRWSGGPSPSAADSSTSSSPTDWPGVQLSSSARGVHLVAAVSPDAPQTMLKLKPGDEIVKVRMAEQSDFQVPKTSILPGRSTAGGRMAVGVGGAAAEDEGGGAGPAGEEAAQLRPLPALHATDRQPAEAAADLEALRYSRRVQQSSGAQVRVVDFSVLLCFSVISKRLKNL